jgi:DNA-binding response OmpR family regulator
MAFPRPPWDGSGVTTTSNPRRVLLVDYSRDEREKYADWFRRQGYCTLQAENAADAYRLATELRPEVMITEVRLPGPENGLCLTRRLKEDTNTRNVRVVILSSEGQGVDTGTATAAMCDLFVRKPCPPAALADAVELLLARAA